MHYSRRQMHGLLTLGEAFKGHPLWNLMAHLLQYKVLWRELVSRPTHINILELRAYLKQEKDIAGRKQSVRVLSGLPSCTGS